MLRDRFNKNSQISDQVSSINQQITKTSDQVKNEIVPMTTKITNLKKAIYDLHIRMGCSVDQANFFMFREAHEWEEMGDTISNLIRAGHLESEIDLRDKRDDPNYHPTEKASSLPYGRSKRNTRKKNTKS